MSRPGVGRALAAVAGCGLLLACLARPGSPGSGVELSLRLADTLRVEVSLAGRGMLSPRKVQLFRSTSRFDADPDTMALPVTVREFLHAAPGLALVDTMVAHNARYYYRARLVGPGTWVRWSNLDSVDIPDATLGRITGSSLLIDKLNYFLEVRCGGLMRKRYPVALGPEPRSRKLQRDRATTPEGMYRISKVQEQARHHRAFDLDYPNPADRARHRFRHQAGETSAGIGGGIQVHGGGVSRNSTVGSVALRNEDMDQLFAHRRVGRGMPVYIVGTELGREDIQSILDYRSPDELRRIQGRLAELGLYEGEVDGEIGTRTRLALAAFQQANGLPATAELDARTSELLSE